MSRPCSSRCRSICSALRSRSLLLGPLSDRFGRRPVVLAGLRSPRAGERAAIAMSSIGGLIVARTLQALGASTGLVIGRAIIRDLYDRERAASMIGLGHDRDGGGADAGAADRRLARYRASAGNRFSSLSRVLSFAVLVWAFSALPETRPDHVTGGGIALHPAREAANCSATGISSATCWSARSAPRPSSPFSAAAPHVVIGDHGAHVGRIRRSGSSSPRPASCSAISSPRACRSASASTA